LTALTSAWEIHLRPFLVIIDSFGARGDLRGASATVTGNQVTLDGTQDLDAINLDFDTIYLPDDSGRASRTYRIRQIAGRVLTLDASPTFSNGTSTWHIPAGVSGELPPLVYNLGPNTPGHPGFDHYDGALFIVQDGHVTNPIRWTSYTSRDNAGQSLSSIRGNTAYSFSSFRSPFNPQKPTSGGPPFRNYCFKVIDKDATYDGVREARFYFATPVTADSVVALALPQDGGGGKTTIRLHAGTRTNSTGGTGSDGCAVSPSFFQLRDELIRLYLAEYLRINGEEDREVTKLLGKGLAESKTLWWDTQNGTGKAADRLAESQWRDKIVGTLWLIRPDEKPLG
jgi:hypothetical protein